MNYTPGPWRFVDHMLTPEGKVLTCKPETPVIINVLGGNGNTRWGVASLQSYDPAAEHEQHIANARLIVASPDLLDACQLALVACVQQGGMEGLAADLRAAIAKAIKP